MMAGRLPELDELHRLIEQADGKLTHRRLCTVSSGEQAFGVDAVTLGNPDPAVPALGVFGGVHGLERIGAEVALTCLGQLVGRLRWDTTLLRMLEQLRLVFMPVVNPGGLWRGTRANPQGIDLMRNAPVDCPDGAPFLLGGQRIGPGLPWYRGVAGAPMQAEAQALCALVETELLPHAFALAIDCHSGFGLRDRLWFPHAHTARPIEHLGEVHAFGELLDETLIHHRYVLEPQSRQYLAHGDLWDHLYLRSLADPARAFLPLTLEMGSWLWVKKNPRQLFSRQGIFNPLIEHRRHRVLRRHTALIDFAMRAVSSHRRWRPQGERLAVHREAALDRWYRTEHTS